LWFPEKLKASDIVGEGAAVDGLLGSENDADSLVALASSGLDRLFAGQSREVVESRCMEYLSRYLSRRYGEIVPEPVVLTPIMDAMRERIGKMGEIVGKLKAKV
jgi:hypothetical protein